MQAGGGATELLSLDAGCKALARALASQPGLSTDAAQPLPQSSDACQAWAEQDAAVRLAILPELVGIASVASQSDVQVR